jgi:hypothetical protein
MGVSSLEEIGFLPVARNWLECGHPPRCWVSECQSQMDPDANALLIQLIKIENEGWELDHQPPSCHPEERSDEGSAFPLSDGIELSHSV